MLDSVKLASPPIAEETARLVEQRLVTRSALDNASGELLWEMTAGAVEGSFDHRVSVRVMREKVVTRTDPRTRKKQTYLAPSDPYLLLEGSVHKAILGHNICGGPSDVRAGCRWLVCELSERLGADLPPADTWEVYRVDWVESFAMSEAGIAQYMRSLNASYFPRRSVIRYGEESLMAPGRTTALKVYHKGPEFLVHDYKRLSRHLSQDALCDLERVANERLRVEVAIKRPKLTSRYGKVVKVADMSDDWVRSIHDHEVRRLINEARRTSRMVRDTHEVRDRLYSHHSDHLASVLFSTWVQLSTLGEHAVRERMARRTLYRHKQQLLDAGISWRDTDISVGRDAKIFYPLEFKPISSDPARDAGEHPTVTAALAPYRGVA